MNNWELALSLAKNDFKSKYSGSALGVVWAFIQPLFTILIYWFVFQVAFQNNSVANVPYVLWLTSGIISWFFFSESWGSITGTLIDYSYLVKKVVFNIKILPIVRIISASFVHVFFILLVFGISLAYGYPIQLLHLQILYYAVMTALLAFCIGKITCVLTAFFKDVANIVGLFVQFGFWLTPIFWDISSIPQNIKWIFELNPVYYLVSGYRDTFVYQVWFFEKWELTLYFWAVIFLLYLAGELLFSKTKHHLADLL